MHHNQTHCDYEINSLIKEMIQLWYRHLTSGAACETPEQLLIYMLSK